MCCHNNEVSNRVPCYLSTYCQVPAHQRSLSEGDTHMPWDQGPLYSKCTVPYRLLG